MVLITYKNIKQHVVNYMLGFMSCVVVVFAVSILFTILADTPVVFLRLAELQGGELDLLVTPGGATGYASLNYTEMMRSIEPLGGTAQCTPRLRLEAHMMSATRCEVGEATAYDARWRYYGAARESNATCAREGQSALACFLQECPQPSKTITLLAIDHAREQAMKLGRSWPYDAPKRGEALLYETVAERLNVRKGDVVFLVAGVSELFPGMYEDAMAEHAARIGKHGLAWLDSAIIPLKVGGVVDDVFGKAENTLDDAVYVDIETLAAHSADQLSPAFPAAAKWAMAAAVADEYAASVVCNMEEGLRMETYVSSDFDRVREALVAWAGGVLFRVGFNQVDSTLPVATTLNLTRFFSLFTGLILNVVVLILVGLAALLIYSLLMVNVETRAFELGMLRMQGMTRIGVVHLLLAQALGYGLPACLIGAVAAQVGQVVVSWIFGSLTGVPMSPWLAPSGVALAWVLGALTPVVASVLPIARALTSNLQDSLDVKHAKVQAVKVTLERSEDGAFSWTSVVFGLTLSVFGFGVYYLFPLALVTLNLSLLMNMFFILLLSMMMGLVVMSVNLEHLFEKVIVALFLVWERRALRQCVQKNLVAHRERNRKTTILFAVAMAFIVFIVMSYMSTVQAVAYQLQRAHGGSVEVRVWQGVPIDAAEFAALDTQLRNDPDVLKHGWSTQRLERVAPNGGRTQLCNVGRTYCYHIFLFGMSPNFFAATIPGFLRADDADWDAMDRMWLSELLYTPSGSYKALVGAYYRSGAGIGDRDTPFVVEKVQGRNVTLNGMLAEAFVDVLPAFLVSKYPEIRRQDVLVSMPTLARIAGVSMRHMTMHYAVLQLRDGADASKVASRLDSAARAAGGSVWDLPTAMEPFDTADEILWYFFAFTTVIAMAVASFSLISSMYTNVYEQTKEIGMLRAIGLPKLWLYRIYVYEAITLVLASTILGLAIGSLVAYSLILQRVLFTQLPLPFLFPWELTMVVMAASILFGVVSSLGPIVQLLRKPIVEIARIAT